MMLSINTNENRKLLDFFDEFRTKIKKDNRNQSCISVYPHREEYEMFQIHSAETIINELRTSADRVNTLKPDLPVVYFSVNGFQGRKEIENVIEHSGYFVIDIDVQDNLNLNFRELKDKLKLDDYVYAVFDSPSGGLKVVVYTDITRKKEHKIYFNEITKYLLANYPEMEKIDGSGININRACYMRYDPDAHLNTNAKKFHVPYSTILEEIEAMAKQNVNAGRFKTDMRYDEFMVDYDEHFVNMLQLLKRTTSLPLDDIYNYFLSEDELLKSKTSLSVGNSDDSDKSETSLTLNYNQLFSKYRYKVLMRTDVLLFEFFLLTRFNPLWLDVSNRFLDYSTRIDESYFEQFNCTKLSTDNIDGITNGLEYCEVVLPKKIKEGYRGKTLSSISMKLIYNNPFVNPELILNELYRINDCYSEDPQPETNPKPDNQEVFEIFISNYVKFLGGQLDFSLVLRKNAKNEVSNKRVFTSKYHKSSEDQLDNKREGTMVYTQALSAKRQREIGNAIELLKNGKKITKRRLAEEVGLSTRQLDRKLTAEMKQEIKEYNLRLKNIS